MADMSDCERGMDEQDGERKLHGRVVFVTVAVAVALGVEGEMRPGRQCGVESLQEEVAAVQPFAIAACPVDILLDGGEVEVVRVLVHEDIRLSPHVGVPSATTMLRMVPMIRAMSLSHPPSMLPIVSRQAGSSNL